jgi:hypothetical protein
MIRLALHVVGGVLLAPLLLLAALSIVAPTMRSEDAIPYLVVAALGGAAVGAFLCVLQR